MLYLLKLQRLSEILRHEVFMTVHLFSTLDIEMTSKVTLVYILYKYYNCIFLTFSILPHLHVINLFKTQLLKKVVWTSISDPVPA